MAKKSLRRRNRVHAHADLQFDKRNGLAWALVAGLAIASGGASAAGGDADKAGDGKEAATSPQVLDEVVVVARNRVEKAQDVPIPVSVVGGKALERENAVTTSDFAKKIPNFSIIAPNPRQNSIAIRGLGKNSSNEAWEPSVGIIIDNVYLEHPGTTMGSFTDLERVEVARGPQGTLLGKNTTLGVINIVTRRPSFTPEYTFQAGVGNYSDRQVQASATGPLAEGVLAYRFSLNAEQADGAYRNTYAGKTDETLNNKDRWASKLQFLWLPSETISARFIADYSRSAERTALNPYNITDVGTYSDGSSRGTTYSTRIARSYFTSRYNSWKTTYDNWDSYTANDNQAIQSVRKGVSAEVNWALPKGFTLTSITARNLYSFSPHNDYDPFNAGVTGGASSSAQTSQEFRLTSPIGGAIDYQLGLYFLRNANSTLTPPAGLFAYGPDSGAFYASNAQYTTLSANAAGTALLQASLDGVRAVAITRPKSSSEAVFGQLNWHIDPKATLTLGLRDTHEKRSNSTVSYLDASGADLTALASSLGISASDSRLVAAKAIRSAQVKTWGEVTAETSGTSLSWLINPSYKFNDDVLVFASASYGEKSPVATFDASAIPKPLIVKPEIARDFEIGVKSLLLNRSLRLNANLYATNVKDYQTNIRVLDSTGIAYTTISGNVPLVTARGIELDGAYAITPNVNVSFAYSFNRAIYADYSRGPCAPEVNPSAATVCSYTGKQLSGAPKNTANVTFDFSQPVLRGFVAHGLLSGTYRSAANVSAVLSDYGWQKAYSIVDAVVGVGTADRKYDLSLEAKNLFDTKYITLSGDGSSSKILQTAATGDRRAIKLVFRAKL